MATHKPRIIRRRFRAALPSADKAARAWFESSFAYLYGGLRNTKGGVRDIKATGGRYVLYLRGAAH